MRLTTLAALLAALILALALAACGGDDDDDTGDDTGGDATTAAATDEATDEATDAAEPTDDGGSAVTFVEIDAGDLFFDPEDVEVAAGEDLTFVLANTGALPHTLTIFGDEAFDEQVEGGDTGTVADGAVGEFVLALDAGDYFFRCQIHPADMTGTITAR
jgi:plastocyanin